MGPREVARAGCGSMMAGLAIVIPAYRNDLVPHLPRLAPRAVVRRTVRQIQDKRTT